jgi:hypothetical protein
MPNRSPLAAFLLIGALAAAARAPAADGPAQVSCALATLPGRITGAGVLCDCATPGPGRVVVDIAAAPGRKSAPGEWVPTTIVKVVAPDGSIAALAEPDPAREQARSHVELAVRAGAAGIWRISVVGGRDGDRVTFGLPPCRAWGLRGEMALGLAAETPHSGWLWVPAGRTTLLAALPERGAITLSDAAGQALPAKQEGKGKRRIWRWEGLPAGSAVRVVCDAATPSVAFDGLPGLLCPDAAAAALLRGGGSEVEGVAVDGPVQARARAWMLAAVRANLAPAAPAAKDPAAREPLAAVQLYGRFGPLTGIKSFMAGQVLDPTDADFGFYRGAAPAARKPGPPPSLYGEVRCAFDAGNLAAAIAADVEPDSARRDPALIARATLAAFAHLARLQGDDLIREEDLSATGGPMIHSFFVYQGALARGFELLRDELDPTARAIWRDGLIAVGDRLTDFSASQTNQWWHVIIGHLLTYCATGEERFRLAFERQALALLSGTGPVERLGQHPAGFFLEAGGPDGHYDSLSATCLCEAFHLYSAQPKADKAVVEALRAGLARSLAFNSCHWLPQPDGSLAGPSAHSGRRCAAFCYQPWPGLLLARDVFPLATTRWLMTPAAAKGAGMTAATFPFVINSVAWARSALADLLPRVGDAAQWTGAVEAPWTSEAVAVARRPAVPAAEPPCRAASGVWELPGQIAWKRGALYGLTFWDVTGQAGRPEECCRTGGAPSALWSAATGVSLVSMHNSHEPPASNHVGGPDDLTHVCVAGTLKGALWWSGRERAEFAWLKAGEAWRITSTVPGGGATITWSYAIADDSLDLEVAVAGADLAEPWLNLPFLDQAAGMALETVEHGARFRAGSGALGITWSQGGQATATARLAALPLPVRCLRIPLAGADAQWGAKVHFAVSR